MRKFSILTFLVATLFFLNGQAQEAFSEKPKLVVGIVVDQLRYEFLPRYYDTFGEGGFKRLLKEGFLLENAHYNYVPTLTGPGHASIYTGTTPAIHGVIGNDWYDKASGSYINCVYDINYKPVGSQLGKGEVSPWRMRTTTVTDELKLSSQGKSKVISISWKDRGAVLPGGHNPDGAYWIDSKTGTFMTSTYYRQTLPAWLDAFTQRGLPDLYLEGTWKPLLPIEKYIQSGPDDTPYEARLAGKTSPTFPYDLNELKLKNGYYDLLYITPYGNDYLTEMTLAAIAGEKLGKGEHTDFLAVSFSTPDGIGHAMGPNSIEVQDTYIRLDKNLEHLLKKLDEQVGKGNYTVFLTSDHGVAEVPQLLIDNNMPGGYLDFNKIKDDLNAYMAPYLASKEAVKVISDNQIYFNYDVFDTNPKSAGVEMLVATELASQFLKKVQGIADVYSKSILQLGSYDEQGLKGMVIRGYNPKLSGDLVMVLESGYISANRTVGSTHGSGYTYDTHVPIIFFGKGIKSGSSANYYRITDIAPTVSKILNIRYPSGTTGNPITEIFK